MNTAPWETYPDLSEDRLKIISEALLNIRHNTYAELVSEHDDNYSRGCTTFGRQRQMLIQLARSGRYSWLTLASPAMDTTVNIGEVPVRFFTDDHANPKKRGFFKRNEVDQLFSPHDMDAVMFRFVVEPAATEEGDDQVFFLGYNVYQEVVVEWRYSPVTAVLHPVDSVLPKAVVQPDAEVGLKRAADDKSEGEDRAASNDG